MKRPERLNLRTTTELRDNLEVLATDDGRSLSNYIEKVLADHVDSNMDKINNLKGEEPVPEGKDRTLATVSKK